MKIRVKATNNDLVKISNPAALENKPFFVAMDFIRNSIGEDLLNKLMNGFEFLNKNENIVLLIDNKTALNYSLIDYEKFKIFADVLKELMGDDYSKLKNEFQFDIIPFEIEF